MDYSKLTIIAALVTSIGCVDSVSGDDFTHTVHSRTQAVVAVPEFVVTGTDTVPDSLVLTRIGLTVSEIRLEPMWSMDSLAYSTRSPSLIEFALDEGRTVATDAPIDLPQDGRYLVSIRLEPVEDAPSFHVEGFVSDTLADSDNDGWPQPQPFDREEQKSSEWTPFEYQSKRAVFFTFNDVVLEPGEQFLTFAFDIRDWADDVREPISNAVDRSQRLNDNSIDVTNQLDSTGNGVDAVMRTGVVRSGAHP